MKRRSEEIQIKKDNDVYVFACAEFELLYVNEKKYTCCKDNQNVNASIKILPDGHPETKEEVLIPILKIEGRYDEGVLLQEGDICEYNVYSKYRNEKTQEIKRLNSIGGGKIRKIKVSGCKIFLELDLGNLEGLTVEY